MDFVNLINYVHQHPIQAVVDLIAFDHAVAISAQAHGYTQVSTFCQKILNFLQFILDILSNGIKSKLPKAS